MHMSRMFHLHIHMTSKINGKVGYLISYLFWFWSSSCLIYLIHLSESGFVLGLFIPCFNSVLFVCCFLVIKSLNPME